jgi:acetyl esterase/lipase
MRRLNDLPILFVASLLLCSSPALRANDAAKDADLEIRENTEYGKCAGETLILDIARPKNAEGPLPAILLIHGGGWQGGNKNSLRPMIRDFAREGYVAMTVGYRLAPKHRAPAQIEDAKCAVRWVRAHAKELGVDPERIGAMGMSAGAHLSLLLGVMDSADGHEGDGGWGDQSSKVQCVVSYFAPTDLTKRDLKDSVAKDDVREDMARMILTNLVGGRPEDHAETLKKFSPITYVNPGDAPVLMFQGTKDNLVPYDQAFEMATALTKAGVEGRVEFILGARHGWGGEEMKRTQQAALDFFNEHLKDKRGT